MGSSRCATTGALGKTAVRCIFARKLLPFPNSDRLVGSSSDSDVVFEGQYMDSSTRPRHRKLRPRTRNWGNFEISCKNTRRVARPH